MRCMAIADIHINSFSSYSVMLDDGTPSRLKQYRILADDLLAYAKLNNIDLVILAGDLVQAANCAPMVLNTAQYFLETLAEVGSCPLLFVIHGNHDIDTKSGNTDSLHSVITPLVSGNENIIYVSGEEYYTHHGIDFFLKSWKPGEAGNIVGREADIGVYHNPVIGCKDALGYEFKNGFNVEELWAKHKVSIVGDIHNPQTFVDTRTGNTVVIPGQPIGQNFSSNLGSFVVIDTDTTPYTVTSISTRELAHANEYHYFRNNSESDPAELKLYPNTHYKTKNIAVKKNTKDKKTKSTTNISLIDSIKTNIDSVSMEFKDEIKGKISDIYELVKASYKLATPNKVEFQSLSIQNFLSIQDKVVFEFPRKESEILVYGKNGCHEKGYKVFDIQGNLIPVENIRVGDQLIGPDSKPRNVLSLFNGHDDFYEITTYKGEVFRVNKDHILRLKRTFNTELPSDTKIRKRGSEHRIVNISVSDFNNYSDAHKYRLSSLQKTGFELNEQKHVVEPYLIGALLGNGSIQNKVTLYSADFEIFDTNPIKNELIRLGINCHSKFIPKEYLCDSKENRLQLLAGLLDTDGSLSNRGFEFSSVSEQLAKDVSWLARSLGLDTKFSTGKINSQYVKNHVRYRVHINGNTEIVPCKIERKKSKPKTNLCKFNKKDSFSHCIKSIKEIGKKEYFGFELDGDHLYLDEQFFIHHNSGKTTWVEALYWVITGALSKDIAVGEITNDKSPKDSVVVEINLQVNDDVLRIVRTRQTGSLLTIFLNGSNITKASAVETQKFIYDILGFGREEIDSMVYKSLNETGLFSELNINAQLEFISRLAQVEILDELKTKFKELITDLQAESIRVSTTINILESQAQSLRDRIDVVKYNKLTSEQEHVTDKLDIGALTEELNVLEARKESIQTDINLLQEEINKYNTQSKEQQELSKQDQTVYKKVEDNKKQLGELLLKKKSLSKGVCFTCNQTLPVDSGLENQIDTEIQQLSTRTKALATYVPKASEIIILSIGQGLDIASIKIKNNKESLVEVNNSIISTKNKIVEANKINATKPNYDTEIEILTNQLNELLEEKNKHNVTEIKNKIAAYTIGAKFLDKTNKNPVYTASITNTYSQFLTIVNRLLEPINFTVSISRTYELRVKTDNGKERPIHALSGGEKRLFDIIIIIALSIAYQELYGLTGSLIGVTIFDEIFTFLTDENRSFLHNSLNCLRGTKIVISNDDNVMALFDNKIVVNKDNLGSHYSFFC